MVKVTNLLTEDGAVWISQFLEKPTAVHAVVKGTDLFEHTVLLVAIEDREEG
jgi:hypothetical protein